MFALSDYHYQLSDDRIAQHPITPAHNSKLLSCHINTDKIMTISDKNCFDLPDILDKWTLLIANNSQVFASRIPLYNTKVVLKDGNSTILERWEIFIVRVIFKEDGSIDTSQCIIRGSDKKHFRPWCTIFFDQKTYGISKEFVDDGIVLELYNTDLIKLCKNYGDIPLPPYITQASLQDKEKYKTSFWQKTGSVATPTAWLHFTESLRNNLKQHHIQREEITLHVGIGTFAPVVSWDIRNHNLHAETITIDRNIFETVYQQKNISTKIITIWTTSTRTIESLPYLFKILDTNEINKHCSQACSDRRQRQNNSQKNNNFLLLISVNSTTITFSSSLFIYPWFEKKIIDGLITNFHLPQTSLVMLVSGLIGYDNRKKSYEYALKHHYRFASFGDAMFIQF